MCKPCVQMNKSSVMAAAIVFTLCLGGGLLAARYSLWQQDVAAEVFGKAPLPRLISRVPSIEVIGAEYVAEGPLPVMRVVLRNVGRQPVKGLAIAWEFAGGGGGGQGRGLTDNDYPEEDMYQPGQVFVLDIPYENLGKTKEVVVRHVVLRDGTDEGGGE